MMKEKIIYALGFFDGVHLGHGALLRQCREMAGTEYKAGAVTFTIHPQVLTTGKAPVLINTREDRKRLMTQLYGMDCVLELPFDRELMTMWPQAFLEMLVSKHRCGGIVCGEDFRFGYRGEGNAAMLQAFCARRNMPCQIIPRQRIGDVVISSTHIRSLLQEGAMEKAVEFLGHPHILTATVISGQRIGRTMGIPTANLQQPEGIAELKHGVYACKAYIRGEAYLAVTNVGSRPTVGGVGVTVEPWILDFEGDLYGETITLAFYAFLRPEKKFDSLEKLHWEVEKNAQEVRLFFEK